MKDVWRLFKPEHAPGIDGRGVKLVGGRWNSPGRGVVYCGASLSLCVLESFVHLPPAMRTIRSLPPLLAVELRLPEEVVILRAEDLGRFDVIDVDACRAIGDAWLAKCDTLALSVPSAVVPTDRNVLLNVDHPEMANVTVVRQEPFNFDARMATAEERR